MLACARPGLRASVVIGGSGLLALGLTSRPTRDVDVVALLADQMLAAPHPLPPALIEARDQVARDFNLPEDWLNAAPADLLDFGLPEGFVGRLERRDYGDALTVLLASRFDCPAPLHLVQLVCGVG